MKLHAVILLVAILAGFFAPQALSFPLHHQGKAAIGTLDVCSHAAPAVSTGGEMPCVQSSADLVPLQQDFAVLAVSESVLLPIPFSSDTERPPIA